MKFGLGERTVYLCNFCGMSNRTRVTLFISAFDGEAAICKPCAQGLPLLVEVAPVAGDGSYAVPQGDGQELSHA